MGVHSVAAGGAFFSPVIARRLLNGRLAGEFDQMQQARHRFQELTPRERQILRLIGRGPSNTEIASELFIATGTVKVHISAILRATGARNRVEAALVAVRARETWPLWENPSADREPQGGGRAGQGGPVPPGADRYGQRRAPVTWTEAPLA